MLLLALGCAPMSTSVPRKVTPRAVRVDSEEISQCNRMPYDRRFDAPLDPVIPGDVNADLPDMPAELRRVVMAAGLEPLLVALTRGAATDLVAAKLQLVLQLSSLEIQVATLVFETQCTGAQMDAALRELDR